MHSANKPHFFFLLVNTLKMPILLNLRNSNSNKSCSKTENILVLLLL